MYLYFYNIYIYIYIFICTYIYICIYKADASAAAKELADDAHVCGRMLTYADICTNRRPQPQQQA